MKKFKRVKAMALALAVVITLGVFINTTTEVKARNNDFTITVNNKQVQLSDYLGRPYITKGDRTMVPLRVVAENMNFKVDWEEKGQIIYVENKALGRKLIFIIGENVATLNDKPKFIDEDK